MAFAFSNSLIASFWKHPHEISKTTKGMTMEFLPVGGTHIEAQNQKFFDITGSVCELLTKIQKIRFLVMELLGKLTSRNFAELSQLTSEMNPENF